MQRKLLVIVLDGVPWKNWNLFGNLEGWVDSGEARKWKMRSVLPSTSASCYASIHTGVAPAAHGVTGNDNVFRINMPDIFSELRKAGSKTGAVTHSFWSEFFNRSPFDPVHDLEYDEPDSDTINHGRFHTMSGYNMINQATPADADLFATLTMLTERFGIDYGILHTCTLDSLGHRFRHDCYEMDNSIFHLDEKLAQYITRWRNAGYEIIVTADHGQNDRGHHGGRSTEEQDFAFYYFGDAEGPEADTLLDQRQLAPTVLRLMGADIPDTMQAEPFLRLP